MKMNKVEIELKLLVLGGEILTNKETQTKVTRLQTLVIDKDGNEVLKSVKLQKEIDLQGVIGKVVKCSDVEEYNIGFDSYYSCQNASILKETLETNFIVNKSLNIKVTNVAIKEQKDKTSFYIYTNFIEDLKIKTFKVKVKEVEDLELFKALKNKNVVLSNINVSKIDFKTFYSINSLKDIKGL